MHYVAAVLVVGLLGAYIVAAILGLRAVLAMGAGWRSILSRATALGPGRLFLHTYRALIPVVAGLIVLPIGVSGYTTHLEYQASPACGVEHSSDCRDLRVLEVSRVSVQHGKSGNDTVLDFAGGYGSAAFYSEDVPTTSVDAGRTITAEVWRGDVTAVVIDGRRHESLAAQADAWILIVAGGAVLLIGLLWLVVDLGVEAIDPDIEMSHDTFALPLKRRRALYILLPVFGALLGLLGLSYIAILAGSVPVASVLAAIYFIGGILVLPVLIVVYVAWFVRAYLNMGALGLRIRHSAWFVTAALLVPPLSLYMPYRLVREVVIKTQAPVKADTVTAWWLTGIGWAALTIGGAIYSSPDPYDTSAQALLSDAALAASVAVGILTAVLSLRLIHAIDAAELDLARGKGLSA